MAVEGTYFRPFGRVVNSLSGIFAPLSCKSRSFSNTSTIEKTISSLMEKRTK